MIKKSSLQTSPYNKTGRGPLGGKVHFYFSGVSRMLLGTTPPDVVDLILCLCSFSNLVATDNWKALCKTYMTTIFHYYFIFLGPAIMTISCSRQRLCTSSTVRAQKMFHIGAVISQIVQNFTQFWMRSYTRWKVNISASFLTYGAVGFLCEGKRWIDRAEIFVPFCVIYLSLMALTCQSTLDVIVWLKWVQP